MYNVKLYNKISKVGLDDLDAAKYTCSEDFTDYDAVLVRSAKLHEVEFSKNLKCIARAGAGVNNIPIDRCSEEGIVVFNTPGANANAVKELVICALLLASRKVVQGANWVKSLKGTPDIGPAAEKGKSTYAGPEIAGKNVEDGCIIAPGGGDNAMASLGLGMSVGDVSVSLGTSGVAAAISENPTYDLTGAVSGFADCTGHYLPLACTINGSRILDAGRAALGVDYDELASLAFASEPGAGGITLVPYFDGERTPNRPDATATLSGMTLANTTRENMARAFVEGLLCSQRDCLELIRSLGAEISRILLIGGGAKSKAIRTLAPSVFGMDVTRPTTDEYVAIGAARQAAWVLSGETEPPAWPLTIDGVETGEPTEAVYEAYAKARG